MKFSDQPQVSLKTRWKNGQRTRRKWLGRVGLVAFFMAMVALVVSIPLSIEIDNNNNKKEQARIEEEQKYVNQDPKVDWVRRDGLEFRCNDGNMIYSNGASIKDDERCAPQ